jgi:GT2 family glycosyltransferase
MPQNLPLVQINLLTYNGEKLLRPCLESVLAQTYPNLAVRVIDNNSTDQTRAILSEFKRNNPQLEVVLNNENLGFAKGHNLGIKMTQAEFVCCLNQDVVLGQDFIQEAIAAFAKRSVAAVQGKLYRLYSSQQKIIDTVGLRMLKNRRIIAWGQGQIDQGQFEKPQEIFGADGAVPVYRRAALTDVKIVGEYFDEDFFMYKEDVDLAWRLRLGGWQTNYQPKATAWHLRSAGDSAATNYLGIVRERRKISKFAKYLAFKNQRLMQLKNEQLSLLLWHSPWFLPKEVASWIYVLLFERYTYQAIRDLIRQLPQALKKRKLIMCQKKVTARQMRPWFK